MAALVVLANAAVAVGMGSPPFAVHASQNNCYGDPPACWFRGRTNSAEQCESLCQMVRGLYSISLAVFLTLSVSASVSVSVSVFLLARRRNR
jgi:hypothetical protein